MRINSTCGMMGTAGIDLVFLGDLLRGDGFPDFDDFLSLPRSYLEQMQLTSADLISIDVQGDSMSPTLESGDRIMINRSDKNPASGGVFAIHDSDALVVKRIERIPATNPVRLKLISDNPNHGTYEVPADETNILGRVVWYARKL